MVARKDKFENTLGWHFYKHTYELRSETVAHISLHGIATFKPTSVS